MALWKPLAFVLLSFFAVPAGAQVVNNNSGAVGGVAITTDGFLQYRQIAATAPAPAPASRKSDQIYISLPRALAQWRAARDAGGDPPADVRYLKGLTQIQDIFIYPADHDIVLAGPAEPFNAGNALEPLGALTHRPVVQLEDLIVAMRAVQAGAPRPGRRAGGGASPDGTPGGRDFYGCSLENPANFQDVWNTTLARFGAGPRDILQAEMKKALGPQQVKLYGIPGDSRLALAMVAADYHLKRISMGVETVPGIGSALGTQDAAPRLWFQPAYEPLLVSADASAYEFRGPRLQVLVGAQQFNPQGATDAQRRFGENFSKNIPGVAARVDAVADLQNVTDCFMLAALIRQDRLAEKAGVDFSWLLGDAGSARYKTAALPVPKTADTIVHIAGNVIAQGGVYYAYANFTAVQRSSDPKAAFAATAARPVADWFLTQPKP